MKTKADKTNRFLALMVTLALPLVGHATVLFQDTFDRADNLNIDADSTGMSGTAAPMTYKETDLLPTPNDDNITQITNSTLYMAYGPNASVVGLESHNFIDGDILTDGGFRISMDLENLGTQNGNEFFCGFGVGISSNEMTDLNLDFNNSTGPRGRTGALYTGVADFYTCYTTGGGGDVQIFFQALASMAEQVDVNVGNLIGTNATLRADFYPDGFGAGQNVDVFVYFNDSLVVKTNFTWTDANQNYLAINARQSSGFIVDNLLVESFVPVPVVNDFSADPAVVDAGSTSNLVALQWTGDFMSGGATYTLSADKAVTYPSGNTGPAMDGMNQVSAIVDGTLDDVEFTLIVDSGGTMVTNTTTVSAVPFAPALTTVLFTDSFDRVTGDAVSDWNVSASQTGVGGAIAGSLPATNFWLETHQDDNISNTNLWNDACLIIVSNGTEQVCRMSTALASSMGLDHNFTNDVILTDGGFSVAMDVSNWNGVGDRDRYSGFGVGLSRDEVMALVDDATEGCARGSLARAPGIMGVSDLWAGMGHVGSGSFQILAEGVRIDEIPLSSDVGTIRIDFGVSDFNAGSFVAYRLYFDQALVGEGFFKWNNDNENYIIVSSRIDNGVDIDNVTIGTVDVPFTAPVEGDPVPATIDLSGTLTNVVITAQAQSNVVSRLDLKQGSLIDSSNTWRILTEAPLSAGETVLDYDFSTNITVTVDATAYGWTNDPPMGFFRVKPVSWKVPVN